jgi:DNA-directed RNA polymerase specialized sigma24 family protein
MSDENEQIWYDLFLWLSARVEKWVRQAQLVNWHGQQYDVSEDIAQEAVIRVLSYHRNVRPVRSLQAFGSVVARNLLRDKMKKEKHLLRFPLKSYSGLFPLAALQEDPAMLESDDRLRTMARYIAGKIPPKQREALLIDIANRFESLELPRSFELTLLERGIRLREFQRPRPQEPQARALHATLLSLAKKRLKTYLLHLPKKD